MKFFLLRDNKVKKKIEDKIENILQKGKKKKNNEITLKWAFRTKENVKKKELKWKLLFIVLRPGEKFYRLIFFYFAQYSDVKKKLLIYFF